MTVYHVRNTVRSCEVREYTYRTAKRYYVDMSTAYPKHLGVGFVRVSRGEFEYLTAQATRSDCFITKVRPNYTMQSKCIYWG